MQLLCVFAVAEIQKDSAEQKGSASPEERQLSGAALGKGQVQGALKRSDLPGPNVLELSYPYTWLVLCLKPPCTVLH